MFNRLRQYFCKHKFFNQEFYDTDGGGFDFTNNRLVCEKCGFSDRKIACLHEIMDTSLYYFDPKDESLMMINNKFKRHCIKCGFNREIDGLAPHQKLEKTSVA